MPLIKSISGIRGTLGDKPGEDLTPEDVKKFTLAFATFLKEKNWGDQVVVGRDARPSGLKFKEIIIGALSATDFKVIDLGLATTPTVEIAIIKEKAAGGIVITASHNPLEWNALKLLNNQGEFLSATDGERILELADLAIFSISETENNPLPLPAPEYEDEHIKSVVNLPLVDSASIQKANFKIVVDGINSVGGVVIPKLLRALGVKEIIELNCEPNGQFAHQPEPLAGNLTQIMDKVRQEKADLGLVIDPDVDRLAFIDENGEMFGEEYTLVVVADYVLANFVALDAIAPGKYNKATVSNLSSSRALKDVTEKQGGRYEAAAVGEVNVVAKMKEIKSVIGGEGNGGIIYPASHYGRDALVGSALFLSALARSGQKMSEFRKKFPVYHMIKDKMELKPGFDLVSLFAQIKKAYPDEKITEIDGLKIDWPEVWVHLRASNTEPIMRLYAEAGTPEAAAVKIEEIKAIILAYIK